MSQPRCYLDWNATAPLRPQAHAAMLTALEHFGNPSSVHAEGRAARAMIEAARDEVAALVGAAADDIVFCSGGSEAVNAVLSSGFDSIVLSDIEHDCVRAGASASGAAVHHLPASADGRIDPDAVDDVLAGIVGRTLLCVQLANNETGVLQEVTTLAARAHARGAMVFVDAVQACGKVAVDCASLGADALAISAHKLGGPKGVGAVVVAPGLPFTPLVSGGGQERRRRAGTENVVGIVGFGAAARAAREQLSANADCAKLRDRLEAAVLEITPDALIVGRAAPRLPNTSCIARPGAAETMVIRFDLAGVAVSSGAACSSGKVSKSHVLEAMGLKSLAGSAIRVSLGWSTRADDIERFLAVWRDIHRADTHRSAA